MAVASENQFPKVILEEVATDGSATANPAADHRALFLGEDGALHLRDSAGTITDISAAGVADILDLPTAEMDDTLVFAPDGTGGVTARAEAGGAGLSSFATYLTGLSGLVHRWKFDEASGNFADDISTLDLVVSGAWTYSVAGAPVGGAVTLGASAKADTSGLGSIPSGQGARTFVIVYRPNHDGAKQALWSYGAASSRAWWTQFINDGGAGTFCAAVYGDDLNLGNAANAYPATFDNSWHLGVATYDGNLSVCEWHDLFSGARRLGAVLNTTAGGNFRIGQDTGGSNQGTFTIDDLAVFSRALNPYEVMGLLIRLGT